MAERQLPKLNVAGSIPVSRSIRINDIQRSYIDLCSNYIRKRLYSLIGCRQPVLHPRLRVHVLV